MEKRWILPLIALLVQTPLYAGVVYEIEVKDHGQSPPKSESIQAAVEGRHLKMGVASHGKGKQGEMIFRGDRREMIVVDHENRTYQLIDEAVIGQLAEQLGEADRMMEEALKNVPEENRAMIEQVMKRNLESAKHQRPKSELRKTGERGDKNGYPCVKYEVWRAGQKIRELWVTDWSNVEGGSEVVDAFEEMADFFKELMDAFPNVGPDEAGIADSAFEHMKEIGGFPVVTRELDGGSLENESVLRSARRQTLDPDAFEPPAGYKRQEMFGGR